MIQNLKLEGFKSFFYNNIEFGNLTILSGLNSSGKSSVIQALLMLKKASKGSEILLAGHGDLSELQNSHSKTLELEVEFDDKTTLFFNFNDNLINIKHNHPNSFPEIIYISAERYGPETSVAIYSEHNNNLGKRGENIFKCIAYNENKEINEVVRHPKSQGDTFGYNLEAWLNVISPNTKFDYKIQKQTDSSFATFNGYRAKNVGFGLSYTLPIITAVLLGSITPGSLVILENPEAHLHPRGQTEIANLIARCVEAGAQILVETHSDHLLNGIRVFAKESNTDFHKKVKIYWFEPNEKKNTTIEAIGLDNNGRLDNCPDGFFDQFEINASKLL